VSVIDTGVDPMVAPRARGRPTPSSPRSRASLDGRLPAGLGRALLHCATQRQAEAPAPPGSDRRRRQLVERNSETALLDHYWHVQRREQAFKSTERWARHAHRFARWALWLSSGSILLAVIALLIR